jgi:prepilin-type N-terminal cleavage/methylation domain-containing protein
MGIPLSCAMRRAFTLPELMLVLAVLGVLFGITIPRLTTMVDRIEVQAAAARLVAAHRRARIMAITRSQVLVLSIDSSELSIRPRGSAMLLWSDTGPLANHVAMLGPTRQFIFSPEGLTLGLSNATLRLSRGASTRTVVVSRLGRVRVTP